MSIFVPSLALDNLDRRFRPYAVVAIDNRDDVLPNREKRYFLFQREKDAMDFMEWAEPMYREAFPALPPLEWKLEHLSVKETLLPGEHIFTKGMLVAGKDTKNKKRKGTVVYADDNVCIVRWPNGDRLYLDQGTPANRHIELVEPENDNPVT